MFCSNCGATLNDGAKFCPNCGMAQSQEPKKRVCPHCGTEMASDDLFCAECGKQVLDYIAGQAPAAPAASAPAAAAAPVAAASAAPAAAAVAAPAVAAVASAGVASAVGAGVAQAATTAVVGAAKTGMSAAKRVGIIVLVFTFLVGAFSAWLAFFVGSPEGTTEEFFAAAQALDFDSMLSCMDPGTENQVRAMMNLTGSLLGSLTGFDIDLEALASLAPGLAPYMNMSERLTVQSVETVFYSDETVSELITKFANMSEIELEQFVVDYTNSSGKYMSSNAITEFLSKYNLVIPGIAKLTAKSALVKVELVVEGEAQTLFLPLQNEGYGDWRIYLNMNLLSSLPIS